MSGTEKGICDRDQTLQNCGRAKEVKFRKERGWRIREKSPSRDGAGELSKGWPEVAVGQ